MIGPDQVWDVLSAAETVHVASGQKTLTFKPAEDNKEELLQKATGRTGNLRAPTLKLGKEFYVGFNADMYDKLGK